MLAVLVLVCALGADCRPETAIHLIRLPETYANPVMCAVRGQAYLAETDIGQTLEPGETVKVLCTKTVNPNLG